MVRNPHLLTIFANFAPRRLDTRRFPIRERYYQTEPDVQVLVEEQRPEGRARGEIVMVHGLEGSSKAGYARSLSQFALERGFGVHRKNMRSCGGTESLCKTMYHSGLTCDTLEILRRIRQERGGPIYLTGFSLGGNVSLKLAGELGEGGREILDGVIAVSTPIDLAACVRKLGESQNRIYERRFVSRLKERIRRRAAALPGRYSIEPLERIRTVFEFDDAYTGPLFGFGGAANYYATQSSNQFLEKIRVPTLLIQAKDDPMIPFEIFEAAAIEANPNIELLPVEHGGHLGFLARRAPRFWLDRVIVGWIEQRTAIATAGTYSAQTALTLNDGQ